MGYTKDVHNPEYQTLQTRVLGKINDMQGIMSDNNGAVKFIGREYKVLTDLRWDIFSHQLDIQKLQELDDLLDHIKAEMFKKNPELSKFDFPRVRDSEFRLSRPIRYLLNTIAFITFCLYIGIYVYVGLRNAAEEGMFIWAYFFFFLFYLYLGGKLFMLFLSIPDYIQQWLFPGAPNRYTRRPKG